MTATSMLPNQKRKTRHNNLQPSGRRHNTTHVVGERDTRHWRLRADQHTTAIHSSSTVPQSSTSQQYYSRPLDRGGNHACVTISTAVAANRFIVFFFCPLRIGTPKCNPTLARASAVPRDAEVRINFDRSRLSPVHHLYMHTPYALSKAHATKCTQHWPRCITQHVAPHPRTPAEWQSA